MTDSPAIIWIEKVELDRLRALNAEMRMALQISRSWLERPNQLRNTSDQLFGEWLALIRAVLAKSEDAESATNSTEEIHND